MNCFWYLCGEINFDATEKGQFMGLWLHFQGESLYLVCELGGAHDFNDVESGPADIIAQHLKL